MILRLFNVDSYWLLNCNIYTHSAVSSARQPLFSVILSIDLSIYVWSTDFCHCKQLQWLGIWPGIAHHMVRLWGYVIYSQCIMQVSLICLPIIICPPCEDISQTSVYKIKQHQSERLLTCQNLSWLVTGCWMASKKVILNCWSSAFIGQKYFLIPSYRYQSTEGID